MKFYVILNNMITFSESCSSFCNVERSANKACWISSSSGAKEQLSFNSFRHIMLVTLSRRWLIFVTNSFVIITKIITMPFLNKKTSDGGGGNFNISLGLDLGLGLIFPYPNTPRCRYLKFVLTVSKKVEIPLQIGSCTLWSRPYWKCMHFTDLSRRFGFHYMGSLLLKLRSFIIYCFCGWERVCSWYEMKGTAAQLWGVDGKIGSYTPLSRRSQRTIALKIN